MNLLYTLRTRILPTLNKWANEIAQEFPTVKAGAYLHERTVGNSGEYLLGIACLLLETHGYPDEVNLDIVISDMTMASGVFADVSWGYPGGTDAQMAPKPTTSPTEIIHILEVQLPLLYTALKDALRKGHPVSTSTS